MIESQRQLQYSIYSCICVVLPIRFGLCAEPTAKSDCRASTLTVCSVSIRQYCGGSTIGKAALDVRPSTFITDTSNHSVCYSRSLTIDLSTKDAIRGIPGHVRPIAVPPIFASKIRHIDPSKIFYTDGSRIDNLTGFGLQ